MTEEANQIESASPTENRSDDTLQRVLEALRGLKFGQVSIIVQDGVVIQIERTERIRLRRAGK